MPKKSLRAKRRKPTAYHFNRCVAPYIKAPCADWEKISRRLAKTNGRAATNAAATAEGFILLSSYLYARSRGQTHAESGEDAYRDLVAVRRALHHPDPESKTNPFRYA